jgi:Flp pilus assembly pilin Flp
MKPLRRYWRRVVLDDSGAQFLEYALLAALIAILVGVAVGSYGKAISELFTGMATWISEKLLPNFKK